VGPLGAGSVDQISGNRCNAPGPSWHPTDAFTWYCLTNSGIGPTFPVVFKFTYKFGVGSCDGREWNDISYGTAVAENTSCMSQFNETPASAGQDLSSKVKAVDPRFDATYFTGVTGPGGFGKYIIVEFPVQFQDSMAYMAYYDVTTKNIVKVIDSFSTWPMRWGTDHGALLVHNSDSTWAAVSINGMKTNGGGRGTDYSYMRVVSVAGRADRDLPFNYFTPCPGGLAQQWQDLGATPGATRCAQITVDGQPRLEHPSAADQAKWPVSPLDPSYRVIQNLVVGDSFMDLGNGFSNYGSEVFIVVKISAGVGTS